ncbi:MAG TPA: NUDIX domain-containing protein [Patescibacteria group bacterium]
MKQKESSVVLIVNDKGEHALQLRAAYDTSYPSHWDVAVAGGIEPGETPLQAAVRELKEEAGIEGAPQYVEEVLYQDEITQDRLYIHTLKHNGPFSPDANEVAKIRFFTLEQIATMVEDGEKFHPEFVFLWQKGFLKSLLY